MDEGVADAIRIAKAIVRKRVPDRSYEVFLFDSRAAGTAHGRSDIDIGIRGPRPLSYETIAEIAEELDEAPTLYSIDVVDFARVPAKFHTVAKEQVPIEEAV